MRHLLGLDHVVLLTSNLDGAERALARLGFRPTPRGVHSAHMGTANTTVMLSGGTYLEAMGVMTPTPANAGFRALLAAGDGPKITAMKTDDAQAAAAAFQAAGVGDGAAPQFARDVALPDGVKPAAFTIAHIAAEATPGMGVFVCQHHTPEVAWRPDYLDQPNGVIGVVEVAGATEDLGMVADAYTALLGADRVARTADRVTLSADLAEIVFYAPAAFETAYPGARAPKGTALGGVTAQVKDLALTRAYLAGAGVATADAKDGRIVVPPAEACGCALGFRA